MAMGTGTYRNSIPVGSTNYTIHLGASYSQLELLGITFVQTLADQDHAATHTGTSFYANNVNRWSLSIDGVLVENQRMIYSSPLALAAEGWANLTTRVFYSELLLHRSAFDTRCIDSNIREWEIHI